MRGPRRKAREAALRVLYEAESRGEEALARLPAALRKVRDAAYAERLVRGCIERKAELDRTIKESLKNWRLERLGQVERNILRIGAYELASEREVPSRVVIDEAVRLAKRYGGEESYAFVNGVLDAVAKRRGDRSEEE